MSEQPTVAAVPKLFDVCLRSILVSPYLLSRAALYLPQKLAHYLLYRAWKSGEAFAVQKLTEKWPHPHLSFDFLHTNSLLMSERLASPQCLNAEEYYEPMCFKMDESIACSVILTGLFMHVQHSTGMAPTLKSVDLPLTLSTYRTCMFGFMDTLYRL